MRKLIIIVCALLAFLSFVVYQAFSGEEGNVKLPQPQYDNNISIEKTLHSRRSLRDFKDRPLSLREISRLLWAAQGITNPSSLRTAPSAGALYPLKIYVIAGDVNNHPEEVYTYKPESHILEHILRGDKRADVCAASLGQPSVKKSAAVIVLAGGYERTIKKYGQRGIRYVHIEAGNASQNIYLQAVSLDLGTVMIGAFDDEKVKEVLYMHCTEVPLALMPVGKKQMAINTPQKIAQAWLIEIA